MQLDGGLLAAGAGEDGKAGAVVDEGGVGGVLDDQDVVAVGEGDEFVEEVRRRGGAGRVVGVVDIKKLGAGEVLLFEGLEVREEVVLREERDGDDGAAEVAGVGREDGVAGGRREDRVAGVDEAVGEHREGGLGADGVVDLGRRVEVCHAEEARHVGGGGFLEGGDAVVGVAAVFGVVDGFLQGLADGARRHLVGLADAEVQHLTLGMRLAGGTLGALDLLEFVDGGVLAEGGAADAVGEKGLDVHGRVLSG